MVNYKQKMYITSFASVQTVKRIQHKNKFCCVFVNSLSQGKKQLSCYFRVSTSIPDYMILCKQLSSSWILMLHSESSEEFNGSPLLFQLVHETKSDKNVEIRISVLSA